MNFASGTRTVLLLRSQIVTSNANCVVRPLRRAMDENNRSAIPGWRAETALTPGYLLSRLRREKRFALRAQCGQGCPRSQSHSSSKNGFSIDRDLEDVADDEASPIHGVVPTDAKVLPVD